MDTETLRLIISAVMLFTLLIIIAAMVLSVQSFKVLTDLIGSLAGIVANILDRLEQVKKTDIMRREDKHE